MTMRPNRWGPAIAPALLFAAPAGAQPVWSNLNGGSSEVSIQALTVHDEDGPGPAKSALYAGSGKGDFVNVYLEGVVRWDGWHATPVGEGIVIPGLSGSVRELTSWSFAGATFPPGLYAGGWFTDKGIGPWNNIARWLPPQWNDVGGGVTRGTISAYNFATEPFESAPTAPPALVIGGQYSHAGGIEAESLARWDGVQWTTLGEGISNNQPSTTATVYAMAVFDDDGPGPRPPGLYIGGSFYYAGGVKRDNIARWDGQNWESVGAGLNDSVRALCVWDEDGPGPKPPALFAGGTFNREVGGTPYSLRQIARWDGKAWTDVGGWLSAGNIQSFLVADEDGPGPAKECLFAGGAFDILPDLKPASGLARWDGVKWTTVGQFGVHGFGAGTHVGAMAFFDEDGPGPNPGGLYVGGAFYYADGVISKHIARWGEPLPPKCYPDCEGDGDLDLFDYLCFQGAHSSQDPYADCEGDGDWDIFDFLCFQGLFADGCP